MLNLLFSEAQSVIPDWIIAISTALTALAAIGATLFYIYSRGKDRKSEVFNQIRFLKDKILPPQNDIIQVNNMSIPKIEIKYFDFEKTRKENEVLFLSQKRQGESEGYVKQTFILNDLEELSLRIIHYGNINNPMLDCIKDSFINTVEYNTYTLLRQRDISNNVYNGIIKLYMSWKIFN